MNEICRTVLCPSCMEIHLIWPRDLIAQEQKACDPDRPWIWIDDDHPITPQIRQAGYAYDRGKLVAL